MSNKEIIQALKDNEKAFGLMSEEMQAKAKEIGQSEMEYYDDKGSWDGGCETTLWYAGDAYRLRPDYEESDIVECDVFVNDEIGESLQYEYKGSSACLHYAPVELDFIGYKYEDGTKAVHARLYKCNQSNQIFTSTCGDVLMDYEVLTPTHVLFKGAK